MTHDLLHLGRFHSEATAFHSGSTGRTPVEIKFPAFVQRLLTKKRLCHGPELVYGSYGTGTEVTSETSIIASKTCERPLENVGDLTL